MINPIKPNDQMNPNWDLTERKPSFGLQTEVLQQGQLTGPQHHSRTSPRPWRLRSLVSEVPSSAGNLLVVS